MNSSHPIYERSELSIERRIQLLEQNLAKLWDEVWWHQLPWHIRLYYYLQGFRSPIKKFY